MNIDEISFKEYIKRFLRNEPENLVYQETSVQIYDIALLSNQLIVPTPLLKAQFSFIVHLISGNFDQRVGGEIKHVSSGTALLAAHGEVTSLEKFSPDVEGFFIIFDDSVLFNLEPHGDFSKLFLTNPVIELNQNDHEWLISLNKIIQTELLRKEPDNQIVLNLFSAFLRKILDSSKNKINFSKPYEIAVKFRQLARQYFQDERGISFYADKLCISQNYLNRCLKTVFGKSSKEILLEITIVQSQLFLQNTTQSISEIAYMLNFDDPEYFARLYKKITGRTPSQFRKTLHDLSGNWQS